MMIRIFIIALFLTFNFLARAADVPSIDLGSDKFDASECINTYQEQCINDQCMNSEDTNCQDQCQANARDKCQEQSEE